MESGTKVIYRQKTTTNHLRHVTHMLPRQPTPQIDTEKVGIAQPERHQLPQTVLLVVIVFGCSFYLYIKLLFYLVCSSLFNLRRNLPPRCKASAAEFDRKPNYKWIEPHWRKIVGDLQFVMYVNGNSVKDNPNRSARTDTRRCASYVAQD